MTVHPDKVDDLSFGQVHRKYLYFGISFLCMVVKDTDSSFIKEWEKKKKESEALHKHAYKKMKEVWCNFSQKKQ